MKRGDVVLFDFPFSDRTGSKLRPAVVVQADYLNRSIADTILALVTRTRRGVPSEVFIDISTPDGSQTGIRHSSVVDCKNVLTADQSFIHATIGTLPARLVLELDTALKMALGLA